VRFVVSVERELRQRRIHWHYPCFDRILLNGLIQPFQQRGRVIGFFNTYRQIYPVTRSTLRAIALQFQRWVTERAAKLNIPIVAAATGPPQPIRRSVSSSSCAARCSSARCWWHGSCSIAVYENCRKSFQRR
jgi:hypothetical protein